MRTTQQQGTQRSRPADEHRFDARIEIKPGEAGGRTDGAGTQLVWLILTDHSGPVTAPDGTAHHRPDVVCPLHPRSASHYAIQLMKAAEQAEQPVPR